MKNTSNDPSKGQGTKENKNKTTPIYNKGIRDAMHHVENELNKGNNLIDYFLLMGIEPSICELEDLYELNIKDLNTKYKSSFTPKILSKFPPFDKSFVNIDDGIISHCFQKTFEIKEFRTPPNPEIFSFILDNYFFSIEHPHKYVTCLLFYESLNQYKKLKDKISNNDTISNKIQTVYSNNQYIKKTSFDSNNSLIKETQSQRAGSFTTYSSKQCYRRYYFPKAICLISVYPFFSIQKKILKALYNYSKVNRLTIPIEKIIHNLLIEVPLPPRGLYEVEYQLLNEKIKISRSKMNELPDSEEEIKLIFDLFKPDQIVEIFKHLLYETKMVIFSSDLKLLTPFIFGLLSIMYPFKYSFQVVSCIPDESYHILESISPFILGINKEYTENFFSKIKVDVRDTSIFAIDLNKRTYELFSSENFPDLPAHYRSKLTEKIENAKNDNTFSGSYLEIFFRFNVNILQYYSLYLNNDYYTSHGTYQNLSINTLFKVKEFIESFPDCDKPFYKKFTTETQIFSDFIFKRMIPKDTNDKLEILFFDENIMKKNNKKIFSSDQKQIFLPATEYDIRGLYYSPSPKGLNKEEQKLLSSYQYRFDQLKHGQEIICVSNKYYFNYLLFPILNDDPLFICANDFMFPPNLGGDLKIINSDLISKSHLYSVNFKNAEMENYIYLSWLVLWAASYWYHDPIEKKFRFQQMLTILDKVKHHDMEIFNLLFEALNKFYEENMIIELYEKLISYRLNPSAYIYSIVSKIMDKKKIKITDKRLSLDIDPNAQNLKPNMDMIINCKSQKFRARTLKNKYESYVISDEVKFYAYENCIECSENLNLEKLCKDFDKMKKDVCWALCPHCERYILPKMNIKLGLEINENCTSKYNTSTFDSVVLYSPFTLKNGLLEGIIKQMKKFLDVDNFKYKFTPLFWDSIWYFYINGLDYTFILPYESTVNNSSLSMKVQIASQQYAFFTNDVEKKSYFDSKFKLKKRSTIIKKVKTKKREIKIKKFENLFVDNCVCYFQYLPTKIDIYEKQDDSDKNFDLYLRSTTRNSSDINSDFINGAILRENTITFDNLSRNSDIDSDIDTIKYIKMSSIPLKEIIEETNENANSTMNTPFIKTNNSQSNDQEEEKELEYVKLNSSLEENFQISNNKSQLNPLEKTQ